MATDPLNAFFGAKEMTEGKAPDKRHNWLYSVVPSFPDFQVKAGIHLAGYCKDCRSAFTVALANGSVVGVVNMHANLGIPVGGCHPVDGV